MNAELSPNPELRWAHLTALIEAGNLLNATLDPNEVLGQLMYLAAQGTDADRATLYLLDRPQGELRSIVLFEEGLREIRLPIESGIAGYVARTGETVNVDDAYADPRFDPQIDQLVGYRTQSILTVPMHDPEGTINGVVQVLNKGGGHFSEEDGLYLRALAEQASLALENTYQHAARLVDCERLAVLYRVNQMLTEAPSLQDALPEVLEIMARSLSCEAGSVLLRHQEQPGLLFAFATGPIDKLRTFQVPLEGSIAGWVLREQQPLVVDDVQADPRFFADVDRGTGFRTQGMLCAPLRAHGRAIGVIEILNKEERAPFEEAELRFLQAVADSVALAIGAK
ncbi:MAG: GAF domain-containing protein [Chloroflexia bacterium]|nr:GAF domain-containing protein [Chloroflexia bacterium]